MELTYFIFNKEIDYQRGYLSNLECKRQGIWVKKDSYEKAVFISRILDSQKPQMDWHRLVFEVSERETIAFKLFVYAAEEQINLIQEFIYSKEISIEEKRKRLSPYLQKTATGITDLLLHEVRGRYLFFIIELYRQNDGQCQISNIKIYFPKVSWMKYLPEIYEKSDRKTKFLERYLAIFQSLYEDLNLKIKEITDYFDMECCEKEFLDWLAQWIGIEESYIWSEKKLRKLLKHAVSLYKKRGTRQGIIDFVFLYIEEEPYIVESFELYFFEKEKTYFEQLSKLYSNNSYIFSVMVREETVPTIGEQKTLRKIIEDIKPVQMELHLIILKPYLFLSEYSYLGINSVLGEYKKMVLDGHAPLSFTTIKKESLEQ